MKIEIIESKVICSNPDNVKNGYFGWPSVARLKNGRLAMVASGFRMKHVCPFGKGIICFSENEGKTWSRPAVVIDTPLDDRDCGILAFGESSVMITSFNNTVRDQEIWNEKSNDPYVDGYITSIDAKESEEKYLGSTFVISDDNAVTFGDVKRIPITSPHGPCLTQNGEILYVGSEFSTESTRKCDECVAAYRVNPDGTYDLLSQIENISPELYSCEPHAIVLPSGKTVVHIRVQGKGVFTLYQSESYDGAKTFTAPHKILEDKGGAPAHLLLLKDGTLISTYGYREKPYGIKVMYSTDEGETWSSGEHIYDEGLNGDLGYPSSVQLENGDILTVYYIYSEELKTNVIMQTVWKLVK